jgi:tetratricopeptide (TPR) repeat protein
MQSSTRDRQIWMAALGVPLLLLSLYPLQRSITEKKDSIAQQQQELLLRSGKLLKRLSLGYSSLLADIYWTRTVQYNGGVIERGEKDFSLLAPLLNVTTDLDPRLDVAYKYGAIFLSEKVPAGAGRPDQAIALVRKGIAANPSNWRLYYHLGFVYYWYLHDYQQAAQSFWDGSKVPGALPWMGAMAAHIAGTGGSRETSRFMWGQIYESTKDITVRANALAHLQALRALDDLDALKNLAAMYKKRTGHAPTTMQDLVDAHIILGIPQDPGGYPYILDSNGDPVPSPESPMAERVKTLSGGK